MLSWSYYLAGHDRTEMDWWLNLDRALPVFLLGDCDHVHCERNHPQQRCIFKRTRWDTLSPRWLVRGWGDVCDIRQGSLRKTSRRQRLPLSVRMKYKQYSHSLPVQCPFMGCAFQTPSGDEVTGLFTIFSQISASLAYSQNIFNRGKVLFPALRCFKM